ncbi:hypothetical protein [Neobacillus sp. SuZ13]|uniref:hypothetical protein n=1 Tax=Neobacillus sp. SuZ13 TaxID=3047875 RepID=UPI0024C01D14|nr:hypothetical protein [Neobacillus sp. SuZ13]WHY67770.1 hypothetical protein QNH17_03725 [Neobacillus sp. SuZ13]
MTQTSLHQLKTSVDPRDEFKQPSKGSGKPLALAMGILVVFLIIILNNISIFTIHSMKFSGMIEIKTEH